MPLYPLSGTTERRFSLPTTRLGAQITLIWMRPLPSAGQSLGVQIESSLLSSLSRVSPGFVRRRLGRHGRCERCRGT
jgi:hypothetical protein